ncbi:MAG: hypothetical protein Q8Q09_29565 [Deltaproteobacteria bacterium]|nr:hypothetical protein [Deltaproteobacteria bacterium]
MNSWMILDNTPANDNAQGIGLTSAGRGRVRLRSEGPWVSVLVLSLRHAVNDGRPRDDGRRPVSR